MTYSEALFFIGKCLTLRHYPERIAEVRKVIRSGAIKWEQIVWVSTGQFVFPVLYLQLKWADLLIELPIDLVDYMKEFTTVNRERNQQLIDQAHEITALLNPYGINPIFLKGTAHLLDGLYDDIAERMVGDIDFLVDEKEMVRAADILVKTGYKTSGAYNPVNQKVTKHYPRLKNDNRTGSVEVHRQIMKFPYYQAIDCKIIKENIKKLNQLNTAFVLSNEHQIIHNILNVQISDDVYYHASIYLRQSYDLLLLSRRENPITVVKNFGKFFHRMNSNLALTNKLLGNPDCLTYKHTWQEELFVGRIMMHINYPVWANFSGTLLYAFWRFSNTIRQIIHALYCKDAQKSIYARLSDPTWYGKHFRSYKKLF